MSDRVSPRGGWHMASGCLKLLKLEMDHGAGGQLWWSGSGRISFKGTLDAFRQWTTAMAQLRGMRHRRKGTAVWAKFLKTLVADLVPERPRRQQPMAVKKRSKYPVLNQPRDKFVERWSPSKRRRDATAKKNALLN